MQQQDENGQLWLVVMGNLQGQGRVKVTRIPCEGSKTEHPLHLPPTRLPAQEIEEML